MGISSIVRLSPCTGTSIFQHALEFGGTQLAGGLRERESSFLAVTIYLFEIWGATSD